MPIGAFGKKIKGMANITAGALKDVANNEKLINAGKVVLKATGTLAKGAISAVEAHNANVASIRIEFEDKDSDELKDMLRSDGFTSRSNTEKSVALKILRERGDDSEFNRKDEGD